LDLQQPRPVALGTMSARLNQQRLSMIDDLSLLSFGTSIGIDCHLQENGNGIMNNITVGRGVVDENIGSSASQEHPRLGEVVLLRAALQALQEKLAAIEVKIESEGGI